MVVKLLESDDLALLEERINMFIIDKDNEFKKENPDCPKLDFKIDIKILPNIYQIQTSPNRTVYEMKFIAVIQY